MNHCNVVAELVKGGAKVNEQASDGCTALQLAVSKKCANCIKALLSAHLGASILNTEGEMTLHMLHSQPTQTRPLDASASQNASAQGTVNIAFSKRAFSERSYLVNGFKRDRSTPSKEKRAKEPSI